MSNDEQTQATSGSGLAIEAEVLSASVAGRDTVSVSIRVDGRLDIPGTKAEVSSVVIVATVPAKVMPA